jgi:hypothetical protein
VLAVVLLAVLVTVTACGGPAPDGSGADSTTATGEDRAVPETPAEPDSLPTMPGPSGPPSIATDGGTKVRLVGEVVRVAAAHVVLRDANGTEWALVGDLTSRLQVGEPVVVTGQSRPDPERDALPVVVVERTSTPGAP